MADDELIDPSSENVFDDVFILDVDDPDEYGPDPETVDAPVAEEDKLRLGLGTQEDIRWAINYLQSAPLGFQTEQERADLLQALSKQLSSAKYKKLGPVDNQRDPDPYEFRLTPISGINQSNIPDAGIVFPLPPEKFEVSKSQDARTYTAINQVEFSLPGAKALADVSLEGMFPFTRPGQWGAGGRSRPAYLPKYITADNYMFPKDIINHLTNLKLNAQPVQLTITPSSNSEGDKVYGGLVGVNYVTITSFTYSEAFGHVADYVFSLSFKQWRPIYTVIKKPDDGTQPGNGTASTPAVSSQITKPAPIKNDNPGEKPTPKIYTIKSGDTLWDISARFLGTGTRWMEIYQLNRKVINDECRKHGVSTYPRGWHIWPGTRLKIPPRGKRDVA